MLIKINNKPIQVVEEPEEKPVSLTYLLVSLTGYTLVLYIMDLVCYTFFYTHPLPWITWIGKLLSILGGLL